jgi:hypothetical protein
MRDLDADFARLRDDISGKVVGPPVPELAARGRRRTRRRIVSAGVAAAVAAIGFFAVQDDHGTRKPPVVSTISPGPVRTHFKPAGSYIAVRPAPVTSQDLILGASSKDPSADEEYSLNVPVCGQVLGSKARPKGLASSLSLESGPEASILEPDYLVRGEQILTFEDEKSADRLMRQLSGDRSCGLAINQIDLGDEAFSVTSRTQEAKVDERRAVVVREHTAIAIYWDRHSYPVSGATKPALATLAEHEANARTMAARLCALGYCADPVYVPVPPGKTLIYWSAAKEGTGRPRWSGISAPGKGEEAIDQPSRARDGVPTAYSLVFLADPAGGAYRTETLLVGADEAAAKLVLNKMVEESRRSETAPHTQAKAERLDIGDEAWHFYHRYDDGEFDASTVNTVVVRQGSVIAIYADKAGSDQPPLVQVSQHVRDARTISARLRALGY